ncbi:DnaJ family domain-containing protein [Anaerobacillus isosaccharinicus]|uniref:DUF1992 domain-containing protein n=1 Tax=Anaerobacillus isosaccharinicus TaxID=1532552 RepID=A0A1S2LET5_9BACI|nr:DnaJ family domain-containing protein [Anaerobacillus isosaccharinicus]MBA5586539.1 DUF1992 domain-containing protein [Anaerobacillus isosaccharinicus]QOY35221.1 DUF1992 domain-containing protein [Anaerobacillus isosaccharinicus]
MEYRDPIGDILKNSKSSEDLEGKGKPLSMEYQKMDTFQQFHKVARDAGYLPEWIKLQKRIADALNHLKSFEELEGINVLIKKHNKICPSYFQKVPITEENYEVQKLRWESS